MGVAVVCSVSVSVVVRHASLILPREPRLAGNLFTNVLEEVFSEVRLSRVLGNSGTIASAGSVRPRLSFYS